MRTIRFEDTCHKPYMLTDVEILHRNDKTYSVKFFYRLENSEILGIKNDPDPKWLIDFIYDNHDSYIVHNLYDWYAAWYVAIGKEAEKIINDRLKEKSFISEKEVAKIISNVVRQYDAGSVGMVCHKLDEYLEYIHIDGEKSWKYKEN